MLRVDERLACSEVLAVYNMLDDESKSKIPVDFVEYFHSHANKNITINIISTLPIEEQLVSRYSKALIDKMVSYL